MTGYQSKKAAALDEEGMYLVHHTKRKVDDDDDIQVYKRPWIGLTDAEVMEMMGYEKQYGHIPQYARNFVEAISAKLKEKNSA